MNHETQANLRSSASLSGPADTVRRSIDWLSGLAAGGFAESLPQVVFIASADGAFEDYNRLMRDYVGPDVCREGCPGWLGRVCESHRVQVADRWRQAVESEAPFEAELLLQSAHDGVARWFLVRALPHRESGELRGWFGTCTDIHAQKQNEAELRQAKEKSDQNGRVKDEFLSLLSHELRTPLSAILGWTQLLEMDALDAKERVEAVQIIKQQAKLQSQLIEDLLEVSRIVNGKFHMRRQVLEVRQVVRAAIESVRAAAASRHVTIEEQVSDDLGLVEGDPQRLQQVVWNLLTNAIKFSPENGVVTVRLDRAQAHVRLRVADAGRGIPAEQLGEIFDRFKQLNTGGPRVHGGLGLGLTIARHIVERHGGTISASSAGLDQGSTFTVMLPNAAVQPDYRSLTQDTQRSDGTPQLDGIEILVVDDEESARTVVAACLKKFGASVQTARNADEAMKMLNAHAFDVLVSDISMPLHDGFDLIRQVRTSSETFCEIPAIALTGFASVDDQTRALDAGFTVHVTKPVDQTELVQHVQRLMAD
ncbi:MAG: ATP-binding protein [Tepidisphaeraceae bacterium]